MKRAVNLCAITAVGLGLALSEAAIGAETGVTVLRGTAPAAAAKADAGAPAVLRGRPPEPSKPAEARKTRSRRVASGWISTGGDTLWLVERRGGGIVGCWLQGSTEAGATEIRCARR